MDAMLARVPCLVSLIDVAGEIGLLVSIMLILSTKFWVESAGLDSTSC